jgi:general secretion pathway protein H
VVIQPGPGCAARGKPRQRGFTLLELMLVIALMAVVVGMATLSLRDHDATQLEEEGARLSALLEGARARSRSMGIAVRWQPSTGSESPGFRFLGLPPTVDMPSRWLDERTSAEVVGGAQLNLGPEPVIGAQQVMLRLGDRRVLLATNGLGPFVESPLDTPAHAGLSAPHQP